MLQSVKVQLIDRNKSFPGRKPRWYAKIKIPEAYRPFHKTASGKLKQDITKSLGTSEKSEAMRRLPRVAREIIDEIIDGVHRHAEGFQYDRPRRVREFDDRAGVFREYDMTYSYEVDDIVEDLYQEHGLKTAKLLHAAATGALTVGTAADEFRRYRMATDVAEGRVSEATVLQMARHMNRFAEWYGNETDRLNEVSVDYAIAFRREQRLQQVAPKTLSQRLGALSQVWDWAATDMGVKRNGEKLPNIWLGMRKGLGNAPQVPHRALAPFEYQRVLNFLRDAGSQDQALYDLFVICSHLGARIDEACRLRAQDVDVDDSGQVVGVYIERTKTPVSRDWVPAVSLVLTEVLDRRVVGKFGDDWLFPDDEITPTPKKRSHNVVKVLNRRIHAALKGRPDVGKTKVGSQSCRKIFTTCVDQSEGSDKIIKRLRRDVIPADWARFYSQGSKKVELRAAAEKAIEMLEAGRWEMLKHPVPSY
ncbi:hypothetical protein OCEANICA350_11932 [Oceanicaulis sp. 350]|nr:hypothetical protein OCEANICA350_11932 [Oceanicaulis sp. 350]